MKKIKISAILPILNEELYIEKVFSSLEKQTVDREIIEYLFIDGSSTDNTIKILEHCISKTKINAKLLHNPSKIVPISLNIGIKNAEGKYIVRLDSHTIYPENYIKQLYDTMLELHADNVGGIIIHQGNNAISKAYASLLSDKFGVGNSLFRTSEKSGFVDTVPFGFFRKSLFEEIGLFNERLVRNQDYEFNSRIRRKGGSIYLDSNVHSYYQTPDSVIRIIKQNYNNGKWNIITSRITSDKMAFRHYVPMMFLTTILIFGFLINKPFFRTVFVVELTIYFVLSAIYSLKSNGLDFYEKTIKFFLFFIVHISYGLGSLKSFFTIEGKD